MASTTYIELFWDCPDCGEQAISALPSETHDGYRCPNCAYNRKRSDTLYDRPESRVIDELELIARIEMGQVDWECKYCGSLNPQIGIGESMMACRVCGQFQTDEFSPESPEQVQVGEAVSQRQEKIRDRFEVIPQNLQTIADNAEKRKSRSRSNSRRLSLLVLLGVAASLFLGLLVWFFSPRTVEVTVQSLPWSVDVTVEQLEPIAASAWQGSVPSNARIQSRERRQRGTQEVQRGFRTIQVEERYKSGTRTETYTDQERYKTGTRKECTTTTTGTGAGAKSCRDVPTYSTRSVQKTKEVPVYDTRLVAKEVPNMVAEPVYDTYVRYEVDEWRPIQTLTNKGLDNEPRTPPKTKLDNSPYKERALEPVITCQVMGRDRKDKTHTWELPCEQFDRIDVRDRVQLKVGRFGEVELVKVL